MFRFAQIDSYSVMPSVNGSTMNMLCVIDYTSEIEQLCSCGLLGRVNTAAESGCQSCIWVINRVNRSCLSRHTVGELSAVCCRFNVGLGGLQRWRCELCVIWRFRCSLFSPPELLSSVFKMLHLNINLLSFNEDLMDELAARFDSSCIRQW